MDQDRVERILAALRARGARITLPRRLLVSALVGADGHLTAEELAEQVQGQHPELNVSTVYRTLDALEAAGLVHHAHLGHGRAVYHLADDTHHHLVCESCGEVLEVVDPTVDELLDRLAGRWGFSVRAHHFALLGRCRACAAAAAD